MDGSRIFWFSGTGNSLMAAKVLSAELSNIPLTRITGGAISGPVGGAGETVGFTFPSYYGHIPRVVKAFIERLEIKPDTYIFAVVTMGGVGQGSIAAISAALLEKGLLLSYGRCVHMPPNYIIKYNPSDPAKCEGTLVKAGKKLHAFAADIAERDQLVKWLPVTAKNLYRNIEALDAEFKVGGSCTGCGLCERICPVRNIDLESEKPTWLHKCEHCMACISWCPQKAIEYGARTQNRRRYMNPYVKAEDICE